MQGDGTVLWYETRINTAPTNADITTAHEGDSPLSIFQHSRYRSLVGGLLYKARNVYDPTERHCSRA